MKYHIHDNGWTVILDDFKFSTATQQDINEIAKLLATNTLVVAHNQDDMTTEDELRVAHMFGNPGVLNDPAVYGPSVSRYNVDPDGFITRVSGRKDEQGDEIGIVGYENEMTWHSNEPFLTTRRPLVWLRALGGSEGSVTSYNNNIMAYNDLDQELKDFLKDKKLKMKGEFTLENPTDDLILFVEEGNLKEHTPDVIHTNIAGKTGLYFPWVYIHNFVGVTVEDTKKIVEPLARHVTQEKYIYHHNWKDGDVVIGEQWLGLHKRGKFKGIWDRLLHRMNFHFPEQDYTS